MVHRPAAGACGIHAPWKPNGTRPAAPVFVVPLASLTARYAAGDAGRRASSVERERTAAVYFLDPRGRQRYLAAPVVSHTKSGKAYLPPAQIAAWGHGIALLARHLAS